MADKREWTEGRSGISAIPWAWIAFWLFMAVAAFSDARVQIGCADAQASRSNQ